MKPRHRVIGPMNVVLALWMAACAGADDGLHAVGTVEMTETDIAATVPARVVRIYREEGDAVRRGDTLVTLSQSTLDADLDQRRARVAAAEAELRDLEAGARQPELDRAEAELRSAAAEAERTQNDADRFAALATAGHISRSQLEAAQTAAKVAANRKEGAAEALRLLREGPRPQRVAAARAAVATARAQLAMAEATAADLVLTAPVDGVVLGRYAEPGEVLPASIPALSLGDPRRLWVRVFVAAPMLERLSVGQAVAVSVSGVEGQATSGRIAVIATRAEFTPRVALTEQERADLLFSVKIDVTDSTSVLKAGLPATVRFTAPRSRRARA